MVNFNGEFDSVPFVKYLQSKLNWNRDETAEKIDVLDKNVKRAEEESCKNIEVWN